MKEMGLFFTGMLALIVLSMAERKEREEELIKVKRETEKKEYKDFERCNYQVHNMSLSN